MVVRMMAPVRTCGRRVASWPPGLLPLLTWLDRRLWVPHATSYRMPVNHRLTLLAPSRARRRSHGAEGLGVMYLVPFDRPPEEPPDRRVY